MIDVIYSNDHIIVIAALNFRMPFGEDGTPYNELVVPLIPEANETTVFMSTAYSCTDCTILGLKRKTADYNDILQYLCWHARPPYRSCVRSFATPTYGVTTTLPITSRSAMRRRPSAACSSGSTRSISGFIFFAAIIAISALRFSS